MMGIIYKYILKVFFEMEVGVEVLVFFFIEEIVNFEVLFSELEENGF